MILFTNLSRTHIQNSETTTKLCGILPHRSQDSPSDHWMSLGEGTEATSKKPKTREKLREVERLGATSTDRVVQCLVFTEGRCESV